MDWRQGCLTLTWTSEIHLAFPRHCLHPNILAQSPASENYYKKCWCQEFHFTYLCNSWQHWPPCGRSEVCRTCRQTVFDWKNRKLWKWICTYICGTDAKLQVHLVRPAPSFKNETLKWAMRIKHKLHFNHLITLALVAHHKRSLLQKNYKNNFNGVNQ